MNDSTFHGETQLASAGMGQSAIANVTLLKLSHGMAKES